jgi:hypothetical protein
MRWFSAFRTFLRLSAAVCAATRARVPFSWCRGWINVLDVTVEQRPHTVAEVRLEHPSGLVAEQLRNVIEAHA